MWTITILEVENKNQTGSKQRDKSVLLYRNNWKQPLETKLTKSYY